MKVVEGIRLTKGVGRESECLGSDSVRKECGFGRGLPGKLLSPVKQRQAVEHVCEALGVTERLACRALTASRSTML